MATKLFFLSAILFITAGCSVSGRLVTNSTKPYTRNFDNTPVGSKQCVLNDFRLREPISGHSISAEWTTDKILKVAEEAGMTNVYYADMHTLSLLLGIYKRKKLIIYGD
jgi:hypothetical protein